MPVFLALLIQKYKWVLIGATVLAGLLAGTYIYAYHRAILKAERAAASDLIKREEAAGEARAEGQKVLKKIVNGPALEERQKVCVLNSSELSEASHCLSGR